MANINPCLPVLHPPKITNKRSSRKYHIWSKIGDCKHNIYNVDVHAENHFLLRVLKHKQNIFFIRNFKIV